MNKIKDYAIIILMALVIFGFALFFIIKPTDDYSYSERRSLAKAPEVSADTLIKGTFMTDFESYTLDQFPLRDGFRRIKALSSTYVFRHLDNNGMYLDDGYLAKLEYPLNEKKFEASLDKIAEMYDKFIKDSDCKVYASVIPDKNYYLAPRTSHLIIDYEDAFKRVQDKTPFAQYIDIKDDINLEDFYKTDQHWKQENILPVALKVALGMNVDIDLKLSEKELETPFYGTYYGQAALPVAPDKLCYLTSDTIESCKVTSYNNGKPTQTSVYDLKKAEGKDAYEMFLGGADPLIVIENPNATSERELVIFRDSFGSSLTPLLISGYSKITLVDLRYMKSDFVASFVKFTNQDVLFMYSTLVLNSTIAMQ